MTIRTHAQPGGELVATVDLGGLVLRVVGYPWQGKDAVQLMRAWLRWERGEGR